MSDPIALAFPPGVVKTQSALTATGRFIDCDGVRFWQGKAQKLGGQQVMSNAAVIGYPRGMSAWNDLTARQLIALGTVLKLYAVGNDSWTPLDITPLIESATLNNPFSTVAGSPTVTVNWPGSGAVVGQYVDFSNAAAVAGLNLNGSFAVTAIVGGSFTITAAANANATIAAGGGATVAAGLEIPPGIQDPMVGYGWGAGGWGAGTWGTPRTISSIRFVPRYWMTGHFGQVLLATYLGGGFYSWDPSVYPAPRATQVNTAPSRCNGLVVTSDYIAIAFGTNYGGTQNFMQWWACAQGDYTNWDVTAIAGPQGSPSVTGVLQDGTEIVGGVDVGNHVTLLFTDTSVYAFQFTGSNFVFDIQRVGKECGLLGPLAVVVVGGTAYWMGNNGFYMYSGGQSDIPNQNDILEWAFSQIPQGYGVKTVASYNEKYKEVWFSFVGQGATECNRSVVYNTVGQFWYTVYSVAFASATRLTGADDRPIFGKTDGYIYQMDNGLDVVGPSATTPQNWYITAPPMELGSGAQSYSVDWLIADNQRQVGAVTVNLFAYDRTPANEVTIDSATAVFQPSDGAQEAHICGREIQAEWMGSGLGCDFRMGIWKAQVQPNAARI